MRVVLLGPPGCGKGTQAARLAARLGVPAVATGDMFRAAVQQGTPLGNEVAQYMKGGELVPDGLTISVLRERIQQPDCAHGYILDGFPRTLPQAEGLKKLLQEEGTQLDAVVNIRLDDEAIVKRLSERRVCRECGKIYHLTTSPPAVEGQCDQCKGPLMRRADDEPETIRRRLAVYREQTAPLIEFYRNESLLRTVDGEGDMEEVGKRILSCLGLA